MGRRLGREPGAEVISEGIPVAAKVRTEEGRVSREDSGIF